jgi:hypothetical protein
VPVNISLPKSLQEERKNGKKLEFPSQYDISGAFSNSPVCACRRTNCAILASASQDVNPPKGKDVREKDITILLTVRHQLSGLYNSEKPARYLSILAQS